MSYLKDTANASYVAGWDDGIAYGRWLERQDARKHPVRYFIALIKGENK